MTELEKLAESAKCGDAHSFSLLYESVYKEMYKDLEHALDPDKQNETKYSYPYPENDVNESQEIPIKEADEEPYL